MLLPGESQGQRSLVGGRLWGRTESDTTEATQQQQQQQQQVTELGLNPGLLAPTPMIFLATPSWLKLSHVSNLYISYNIGSWLEHRPSKSGLVWRFKMGLKYRNVL